MADPYADTIVALSTPPGRSALAIVRLSGPQAIPVVSARFRGRMPLAESGASNLHVGRLFDADGEAIDEVVVGLFRAPHSYTGEDVVEISCHGNPIVVSQLLDLFVTAGVRPAEPGEFTRRAFMNGRLDLSQAEAVGTLIEARTEAAARAAMRQLGGEMAAVMGRPRRRLLETLAVLEAQIDFPDENLTAPNRSSIVDSLSVVIGDLEALRESARRGRALARATTVVIAGRPNVGKSSLFNALLRRDRSIVHESPGTTRDVVDAEVVIGNLPVRLVDTAGLVSARDAVEAEGVRRSRRELASGDRVLLVADATARSLGDDEWELVEAVGGSGIVLVANKSDLGKILVGPKGRVVHFVSALRGEGLEALENAVRLSILEGRGEPSDGLVVGLRQEGAMEKAVRAAREGRRLLVEDGGLELVAEELRGSVQALGEITGENAGEDLLDLIFSEFCVGK